MANIDNRPEFMNRRLSLNTLAEVGHDASEKATHFVDSMLASSNSKDEDDKSAASRQHVMNLSWSNLSLGEVLGNGFFSDVCNAKLHLRSSQRKLHGSQENIAVKKLRPKTLKQRSLLTVGATDLFMEATILEHLQHENIIRIVGKKGGNLKESLQGEGYFLIMEQLFDTLDKRIIKWKSEKKSKFLRFRMGKGVPSDVSSAAVVDRLEEAALGIAKGMEYIHSKKILFRDLKPDNVGFNSDNQVKIFDFGLARHVDPQDDDRLMTAHCGTLRYMAPENAKGRMYGLPADVYSFGLLLWEICNLQKPYSKLKDANDFENKVFVKKVRPPLKGVTMSKNLKSLISSCWEVQPESRPDFNRVAQKIENEITAAADNAELLLEDELSCCSKHSNRTISDFRRSNSAPQEEDRMLTNWSNHSRRSVRDRIFKRSATTV